MYDQDALTRMASALPNARLIAILRDPVDRAYSHYWHTRSRGDESLSFEQALDAEERRLAEGGAWIRRRFGYLRRGQYIDQLLAVTQHYPRSALYVVFLEELISDASDVFADVCDHLGIDSQFRPGDLGMAANRYASFRSLRLRNWAKRLPKPARGAIGRLNRIAAPYPPMAQQTRRRLEAHFSQYNDELAAWLDRDLPGWEHGPSLKSPRA